MMYELSVQNVNIKHVSARLREVDTRDVVAITGAGISVESGLPLGTEQVVGVDLPSFFRATLWSERPKQAFDAYRHMTRTWRQATPSEAHQLLARMGAKIITQNIDGLHRDAGSRDVIEIHGNLRELMCRTCGRRFTTALASQCEIPMCPSCHQALMPAIVLEGEEVRHIARAVEWVTNAPLLLVIGTQLHMEPVRHLREVATRNGIDIVWIVEEASQFLEKLFPGI